VPFITQQLQSAIGPVIAVSDYMRQVPDQIRQWVQQDFYSLGTDGWGMSDTRGALRRHFLVDAESITTQALAALAAQGAIPAEQVALAVTTYQLADPKAADAGNTEGTG
jgi:pyruvate dehydrogenase E1 component